MNEEDFVMFPNADVGIRLDRLIAWLPSAELEPVKDVNGNPVRPLVFYVEGGLPEQIFHITIMNAEDIKRFLAGVWNQTLLVKLMAETCQAAREYLDSEYNDGDREDTRPHWGDCPELDDLHNQLGRMIALATGEMFTPRE